MRHEPRGLDRIARDIEYAGEVVAAAGGHDPERPVGVDERAGQAAHEAVAAHRHHGVPVRGHGERLLARVVEAASVHHAVPRP